VVKPVRSLAMRRVLSFSVLAMVLAACATTPVHPVMPTSATSIVPTDEPEGQMPTGAIAEHRIVQGVAIDGGDLVMLPAPGVTPTVSLTQAQNVVTEALTASPGTYDPSLVALGTVTLSPTLTDGLPTYRNRLAWVVLLGPQGPVSCPAAAPLAGSSPTIPSPPSFTVVILAAMAGDDALTYRSRGSGACGGGVMAPSAQRADEVLSVPWTYEGQGPFPPGYNPPPPRPPGEPGPPPIHTASLVRFTVPACGAMDDSGTYDYPTGITYLYIDVRVPIDPPADCPPAHTMTFPWVGDVSSASHAPTGLASGPEL
jgi:hypothetical protein